jgi:hypothetical protein
MKFVDNTKVKILKDTGFVKAQYSARVPNVDNKFAYLECRRGSRRGGRRVHRRKRSGG